MHDDNQGAIDLVERQVRRLLTGDVTIWELAMTGGLWRLTGDQVMRAAIQASLDEEDDEPAAGVTGASPGAARGRAAGPTEAAVAGDGGEDVKGPHASLAVRMTQRDPDRRFVLGERLPYVLLQGEQGY
jgi:DNA polymerase delta subunit 1